MSQEPYYCNKCEKKHFRGKVYEEHAEFAEGITTYPEPPNATNISVDNKSETLDTLGSTGMASPLDGKGSVITTINDVLCMNCGEHYTSGGPSHHCKKGVIIRDDSGKTVGITIPSMGCPHPPIAIIKEDGPFRPFWSRVKRKISNWLSKKN